MNSVSTDRRCCSSSAMTWLRHSRRKVPITRSAMALAVGAWMGVAIASIPMRRARSRKSCGRIHRHLGSRSYEQQIPDHELGSRDLNLLAITDDNGLRGREIEQRSDRVIRAT